MQLVKLREEREMEVFSLSEMNTAAPFPLWVTDLKVDAVMETSIESVSPPLI